MHFKFSNIFIFLFLLFLIFFSFSCDSSSDPVYQKGTTGPVTGETRSFGNGKVTPFIETVKNGPPVNVGVAFQGDIKGGIDSANSILLYLKFTPTNNNSIYDHITVRWNPNGTVKTGAFSSSYIAVDFNLINENKQNSIVKGDSAKNYKQPPSEEIPSDYKLLGNSATDNFGALFYDSTSADILNGKLSKELTYGYFDGEIVSHEVAFTNDYLTLVSKFVGEIKQPLVYPKGGYYPGKYVISYEPTKNTFTITLTDFIKH